MRSILSFVLLGSCLLPLGAHATPPPASAYAELPVAGTGRLSPDGKSLAFISGAGGTLALVVSNIDTGRSLPLPTGNWNPRWVRWKDNQTLLASLLQTTRALQTGRLDFDVSAAGTRLLAIAADGSKAKAVVFDRELAPNTMVVGNPGVLVPNVQDDIISTLPNQPGHILVEVPQDVSDYPYPSVFNVSLWNEGKDLRQNTFASVLHWSVDQNDIVRAGITYAEKSDNGDFHSHILARASAGDDWHKLDFEADTVAFDAANPNTLYALLSPKNAPWSLVQIDIATGTIKNTLISGPSHTIQMIVHDGLMVGYYSDTKNITYTDPAWADDAITIASAAKISNPRLIDRSSDEQRVTALITQDGHASELWLLDRTQSPANLGAVLTDYEDVPADQVAVGKWTSFKARDGLDIPLLVTLPPGATGPIAFVVMPHDEPASHDTKAFNWMVQFLISRGYGVLQPQFRGSTGFGADFEQKGHQQWGLAMQDDITDATRWLIGQHLADPKKICIVGVSYGGYAALEGAAKEPALYACAAAIAPITDLPSFIHIRRDFNFSDITIPTIGDNIFALKAVSPAYQANQIQIPILLIHGRSDFTVPVKQTEEMEQALKDAGKTEQTIYLPTANHFLDRVADRLAVLNALEAFLAKSL